MLGQIIPRRSGPGIDLQSVRAGLLTHPPIAQNRFMPPATTKLTTAVEEYFSDLRRVRASGGATGEKSYYPVLTNLLNAIGGALRPQVYSVSELAEQGAGYPDLGLYAKKQVQKGQPKKGHVPKRGVVVVKPAGDDAWLTASLRTLRTWHAWCRFYSAQSTGPPPTFKRALTALQGSCMS